MVELSKTFRGRDIVPATEITAIVPTARARLIATASKQEKNTSSRPNIVVLLLVLSYIGAAILVFHFVEGWSVIDCVYYSIVIVTTVGYGDITPVTKAGKAATIFFAFYGICTIGFALGKLASILLDRQKAITKQATQLLLKNVDNAAETIVAHAKLAQLDTSVVKIIKPEKSLPKWTHFIFFFCNKTLVEIFIPILVSIGAGLIVGAIEGWPILDCFYYSAISITTVGFGDLSPKSQGARIFAIFFLPMAVVSVAHGFGSVIGEVIKRNVMKTKISMEELIDMDANGDGKVSQLEYLSYMLVKLSKADQDDINAILAQFRKLDRDGSGELDREDLRRLDKQLKAQGGSAQQPEV